jgi:hypothetical protein
MGGGLGGGNADGQKVNEVYVYVFEMKYIYVWRPVFPE